MYMHYICKAHILAIQGPRPVNAYAFTFEHVYSGPCNLRPLHLTIPSILRMAISDTTLSFQYKYHSILRPPPT